MKIVMPGGSGQVGTLLARAFVADGHEVVVLPGRLLEGGFEFQFPHWPEAARDLLERRRQGG